MFPQIVAQMVQVLYRISLVLLSDLSTAHQHLAHCHGVLLSLPNHNLNQRSLLPKRQLRIVEYLNDVIVL